MCVQGYCPGFGAPAPPVPPYFAPPTPVIGGPGKVDIVDLRPCVPPPDQWPTDEEIQERVRRRQLEDALQAMRIEPVLPTDKEIVDFRPTLFRDMLDDFLKQGREVSETVKWHLDQLRQERSLIDREKWELAELRAQIARDRAELEDQSAAVMEMKRAVQDTKVAFRGGIPITEVAKEPGEGSEPGVDFSVLPIAPTLLLPIDRKELWEEKVKPFLVGFVGGAGLTIVALALKEVIKGRKNKGDKVEDVESPSALDYLED